MSRIIIVAHEDTLLDSLKCTPSLIVSTITSSLLISHGIRKDTTLYLFFREDEVYLAFLGNKVKQLRPDEQSVMGILRKAKLKMRRGVTRKSHIVHPGILIGKTTLNRLISKVSRSYGNILKLKSVFKYGLDIRTVNFNKYTSFLIIVPLIPSDDQLLENINESILNVRLSRTSLDAPKLIILFHNEVDRHVFKRGRY